jgi:hypothetical protein
LKVEPKGSAAHEDIEPQPTLKKTPSRSSASKAPQTMPGLEPRASVSTAAGAQPHRSIKARSLSSLMFPPKDDVPEFSIAAGMARTLNNHALAVPEDARSNHVESANYAQSASVVDSAKPAATYKASLPEAGDPWVSEPVGLTWNVLAAKQDAIRAELASGQADPKRTEQLRACLAVDLREVPAGTKLHLAPKDDISTEYRHFRAICQGKDLTLKNGKVIDTEANVTLPVLLRTITEGNKFAPNAHVPGNRADKYPNSSKQTAASEDSGTDSAPYQVLSSLVKLKAPDDPKLTQVLGHLLGECPKLRADLGAVALMDMEQQISRTWQTYLIWGASTAVAFGVGFASDAQEKSVRANLGMKPDEKVETGLQKFALTAADATTSGDSEAGDGLLVDMLDKATHGESIMPDASTPLQMSKAWMVGTLTAMPASYLTYANLSRAATICASLPANIFTAIGSSAPLPMTLQKRNDHSRATLVEKVDQHLIEPMSKDEIGKLIDCAERISTGGQIMQKGETWAFVGGLITWGIQCRGFSDGFALALAQRLLLNPMEAHSIVGGGLLADYVSFLGATRAEKSANMNSLVIKNALEGKSTTMEEVVALHEPQMEKYVQGFGRGLGKGVNVSINGFEDATRAGLGKVTGGWVEPHMRHLIDYDKAAPGQRSLRPQEQEVTPGEILLRRIGESMELNPNPDVDLERGDRDFSSR